MEYRTCKVCGETKEAVRGTWATKYGVAEGRVCLVCTTNKSKERYATPKGKLAKTEACAKVYAKKSSTPEGRAEYLARSVKYQAGLKETPEGRELLNERSRSWVAKNRETVNARSRAYNAERRRKFDEWRLSAANATKAYRARNIGKVVVWRLARRTSEQQRTPKWLTDNDRANMDSSYAMAKWLSSVIGVPYHVDHVVPLNGASVSGLHVPNNLSVVRGTYNMQKSNKWVP